MFNYLNKYLNKYTGILSEIYQKSVSWVLGSLSQVTQHGGIRV